LTGRHAKRRTRLLIYWNSSPPNIYRPVYGTSGQLD
jgi:hypothetical protein